MIELIDYDKITEENIINYFNEKMLPYRIILIFVMLEET